MFHAGRVLRALGKRGAVPTKCAESGRRMLLTPLVWLALPVLWQQALALDRSGLEHGPGRAVEPASDRAGARDGLGAAFLVARAAGNGPVAAARRACTVVADLPAGRLR